MRKDHFLFKIIGGLLLFFQAFSFQVFANERLKEQDITKIFLTLEERREINPDVLNMRLSINAKADKEADVINMLGTVDKSIRSLKLKYSGGSYSVNKNCFWEKNKWKCVGYTGDLHYNFQLKEPKEQNSILEAVENIKELYGEKLTYSVTNPQWVITERSYKETEKNLKMEIISAAIEFAKLASEKIGRQCFISSIDYDFKRPFWESPITFKKAPPLAMERHIEAPEPSKEEKDVIVKAKVIFICVEKGK